jgi:hypothetical protein
MSYQWAEGKIWQGKFDFVYRITLKTLLDGSWKENYDFKDK